MCRRRDPGSLYEASRDVSVSVGFSTDLYVNIATFFFFLSMQSVSPYLSQVAIDLGADEVLVSLVGAMYAITAIGLRPLTGLLNDRGYASLLILLGGLLNSIALAMYLFAGSIDLLFIGRAIQGMGIAMFIPTSLYIASIGSEETVSRRIANRSLLIGLSAVIGPLVGGLLASTSNWRILFTGSLVIASIAVAASYRASNLLRINKSYAGGSFRNKENSSAASLKEIFRNGFMYLLIVNFLFSSAFASLSIFMPAHHKMKSIEPRATALYFALSSIANLGARAFYRGFIKPSVLARYGLIGLVLSALALTMISTDPADLGRIYIAALLFGSGMGLVIPSMQSLALTSLRRESRGLGSSVYTMMFDAANMISPPLLIMISHRYDVAIRDSIFFLAVSIIIFLLFIKRRKQGYAIS